MAQLGTDGKGSARPLAIGALLVVSLLWASGPLRSELLPERFSRAWPPLAAQALPMTLLTLTAGTMALCRKAHWPRAQRLRSSIWIGLGLFTAPAILIHFSAGRVPGQARIALFTLVPVFSIVLEPYLGNAATRPIRGALPAAFLAVLGALLVFQVTVPASLKDASAVAACVLTAACIAAANCYAVVIFRDSGDHSAVPIAAIAGSAATVSLGIASLLLERSSWQPGVLAPGLLWAAAVELPALLLLFWLMRRLSATRMATCFVLGPLIVVPVGALLMQMPFAPRTLLGLFGMAAGAGYLLCAPESDAEPATLLGRSHEP